MTPPIEFLNALVLSLTQGTFHKLALGKPGPEAGTVVGASGRLIDLKAGVHLSLTKKTPRTEEVINLAPHQVTEVLLPLLGPVFRQADLYTSQGSLHLLFSKKSVPSLVRKSTVTTSAPSRSHNKEKPIYLNLALHPWTKALGLATQDGSPVPGMKDKIQQVEKFLELLEPRIKDWEPSRPLRIIDLGAGRGYLSFALYQWLTLKGWAVELEAVEVQRHLVDQGNKAAAESGFSGLKFTKARIDEIPPEPRDMVIVLHACDTATDDALALGLRCEARWIFAAPCCHQELRANLRSKGGLEGILKFGILLERQAEILTDGLRSLVLESRGYKTGVMEFVPAEHSGKNLLITATLVRPERLQTPDPEKLKQVDELRTRFSLERVYLQALLELENLGDLTPPWRRLGPVAQESREEK